MKGALALLLGLPLSLHAAQIYRCSGAGGVAYQETPCEAASTQQAWAVPEFPAVNTAERERILQREAALEARLLKRAEIEAAERIARDQRRAREVELEAERERASQAAEPVFVVPVFARPHRVLRPHRYGAPKPIY